MAVTRQANILSQQRIEVMDLRSIESGVANDFDVLAGSIMAGQGPLVITGLTISVTGALGNPAANLVLNTAGAVIMHPGAAEAGTIFKVPTTQAAEVLNATNAVVIGSFASGATNYIGIDLLRSADQATADLTKFLDADTSKEVALTVPKARTMGYRIYISQQPFSVSSNILPVALVVTDTNNNVSTITDARQMFFRLGTGGDIPQSQRAYTWPDQTRFENPITYGSSSTLDPFAGGDKGINSMKSLLAALQSSIWELRGGHAWYSPVNRDNALLLYGTPTMANGDNFTFNSGTNTITWQSLKLSFENSAVSKNDIADNATTGLQIFDQQCLYVDMNRDSNAAPLVPAVANLMTLGTPVIPGTRIILAWRDGANIFTRNKAFNAGRAVALATTTSYGIVELQAADASGTGAGPLVYTPGSRGIANGVVGLDANTSATIVASGAGDHSGLTATAIGAGIGVNGVSSSTGTGNVGVFGTGAGTGTQNLGIGGQGAGATASSGIGGFGGIARGGVSSGTSGVAGSGFQGTGGNANNTNGVAGHGIVGQGGLATGTGGTGGNGVVGTGGTNGIGVLGNATGTGAGVAGVGNATANGVLGVQNTFPGAAAAVYGKASIGNNACLAGNSFIDISDAGSVLKATAVGPGQFFATSNCRGWGNILTGGSAVVRNGINYGGATFASSITITLQTGFAAASDYAVAVTCQQPGILLSVTQSATSFVIAATTALTGASYDLSTNTTVITYQVHGAGHP